MDENPVKLAAATQPRLFAAEPPAPEVPKGVHAVFSPADAGRAFNTMFLGESPCRHWILSKLHKAGPTCPHCGLVVLDHRRLHVFWTGERLTCEHCKRPFKGTTKTFLAGMKLDFRSLFIMAVLIDWGMDNQQIARVIERDPETVRLWRHKFTSIFGMGQ